MSTPGVLMLDTRFPCVVGEIDPPATFTRPVRCAVVREATATRLVRERDPALPAEAGARTDTPVKGLAPGCALQRTLQDDLPGVDRAAAEGATGVPGEVQS